MAITRGDWIQSSSNKHEFWWPREHMPIEWEENDLYHYQYTKNEAPSKPDIDFHDVCFDRVMHATHTCYKRLIISDDHPLYAHFKAHTKSGYCLQGEALQKMYFLWLSPHISGDKQQAVYTHMKQLVSEQVWRHVPKSMKQGTQMLIDDENKEENTKIIETTIEDLSEHYGGSPSLLQSFSRYGSHGFDIRFATILDCLARYHNVETNQLEFRNMGTFRYQQEWMHVVLICPPKAVNPNDFPLIPNESMVFRRPTADVEQDTFHWYVRSTHNQAREPRNNPTHLGIAGSWLHGKSRCKWEHLTFACLMNSELDLRVPLSDIHYTKLEHTEKLCIPKKKNSGQCPEATLEPKPTDNDFIVHQS